MRGKCERGHESVNAGAEVQTRARRMRKSSRAMSIRGSAFSTPWLQFHGGGAADVYIIIRVRACCGGESALNPPTSQPIPVEDLLPPRTATRTAPALLPHPRSPDARPQAARCTPADPTTHSSPKACSRPRTATRPAPALLPHPRSPDARPPTSRPIPRRRPSLAPAQRHALAEHFRSPTQRRRTPAGCAMHSPRKTFARPRSAALPPSVPLRAQKKRHRTVHVRCRMSRSTVVAVGHWGW